MTWSTTWIAPTTGWNARRPAVGLTFLGAAGEVTGSCYLVDAGVTRFLMECGLFQGGRAAAARNRRFAFDPRSIDFVLLSHAHIDHSGLLPRLAAQGFAGPVYATGATCDLLGVMLPDSGHLQEREAEREGKAPLYTVADATRCLSRLVPVDYGVEHKPHPSVRCTFRDAGHILGSAILDLRVGSTSLVFSGDLGQPGHPIVHDPEPVESADVLLVESTYGNRSHKSLVQTLDEFAYALNDTLASRKGNVVIPAFAVGRTQDVLYFIAKLRREGRIGASDVYVDSPMATAATRITLGRRIVDGAKTVRIFGEPVPVRAKIFTIGGLSAHADRPALFGWLGHFKRPPRQTWVVHGEPLAAQSLRDALRRRRWRAGVPARLQAVALQ